VRKQDRVHALLEARAVTDEVQPPACTFTLGTNERVGQPDRRHQIASGELGQGIDPVRLARQRRETFHLLRVGDLDPPPRQLEPIVHEARTVHRLDRGADRCAMARESLAQARAARPRQAVMRQPRRSHPHRRASENRDACD